TGVRFPAPPLIKAGWGGCEGWWRLGKVASAQPPPSSPNLQNLPNLLLDGSPRPIDHPLLLERCLGGGETGDRHAERGAGHVVHAHVVAELHRRRLTAVLPANADLEVGPGAPAQPHRELDELADALLVEYLERVVLEDPVLHIEREEPARVVA